MSKSVHITIKYFKSLTKSEIDKQAFDPNSDLNKWREKSIKRLSWKGKINGMKIKNVLQHRVLKIAIFS